MTAFPAPRRITLPEVTLSVHEAGSGPPVVMCHGFPELAWSWRHQIEALSAAGFRAIEMVPPKGTSFRIVPNPGSFAARCGVSKAIVSLDLRKNRGILKRAVEKRFVIEVSLHDERENYLAAPVLGFALGRHIHTFSKDEFDANVADAMADVYRVFAFQFMPPPSPQHEKYILG